MPLDPTRTPLEIDPVTGDITVSNRSPLHPIPQHRWRSPR
jgi:hypothetical protein